MSTTAILENADEVKANMDSIYVQPDPRAYFRELGKLDYAIPDEARPIFARLAQALSADRPGTLHALDLGCSYGINAALLKRDLAMADLYAHWTDPVLHDVPSEAVMEADRSFFAQHDVERDIRVIGLDQSEPAIAYAEEVGILDRGVAIDLEQEALPAPLAAELAPVDLVVSTGCVGYVTERSFAALLPAVTQGQAPWIGNFVLRMFPFDPIEEALAGHGYVTEKLEGETFVQRNFVSEDEQARVIGEIEALGLDPSGLEAEGVLHAEFFLSRPADQADRPVAAFAARPH